MLKQGEVINPFYLKVGAVYSSNLSIIISGSTFDSNYARDYDIEAYNEFSGGALYISTLQSINIYNSTFINNYARYGGAIRLYDITV